ncbi:Hydrogen peroxide-inducible genes activator (plasmid) [Sulfitobacter sp. THAF37]|uniref:LysR family transcriptional regulator n=1 Tax=Sulfitobacter sp. THAF37 TaxID=2587855 RepID=UPI001267E276|nr:LysR family transcriptional regulator [Sulfitobacter sp. THAF37]QFT60818.1 Hydrogen peroxide-inducible genes activator [Sulfitobacter sp. THAF37]
MKLRQLKYFVATAETAQVSRAATALSISQSSVTTAIRDLEASLGAKLFHRTQQGMDLTDAGRELLASAYVILGKLEDAKNLRHRDTDSSGTIRIAASYTVMGYFLPYHLDRLRRLHPNLEIQLHELNRDSIEEGLLGDRFDVAVMLTSNITNARLDSETLLRSTRRLWVASGHRFEQRRSISFEEIAEEEMILLTVDEAANTAMKYWSSQATQPRISLRTSSIEAVRSMVANGQGITILTDMVYRPWSLEGKRIATVLPGTPVPTMDVGLAWRRGAAFSPQMDMIYAYFHKAFNSPFSA